MILQGKKKKDDHNVNDVQNDNRRMVTKLKRVSSLYRLDPFLDSNGVMRVGGRIRRANIPESLSHPVILPQRSHVTELVIKHYYEMNPMGRGITTVYGKMVYGSLVEHLRFHN